MALLIVETWPLMEHGPGQDERHAEAVDVLNLQQPSSQCQQETADEYGCVVLQLNAQWRVIECPDRLQWIIQRRKRGGAERPWRAVHYCRTRKALLRLCATSCWPVGAVELDLLAALPERITPHGQRG
jgi:hypothetical protein